VDVEIAEQDLLCGRAAERRVRARASSAAARTRARDLAGGRSRALAARPQEQQQRAHARSLATRSPPRAEYRDIMAVLPHERSRRSDAHRDDGQRDGQLARGRGAQARRAEQIGFATFWLPNIFGIDAITGAALVGHQVGRIEFGTAVVPTYPRHPVALAQQSLTAAAATGGRFTLGIGLSHKIVIETCSGSTTRSPRDTCASISRCSGRCCAESRWSIAARSTA
jgi:hypothetical protein